MVKQLASVIETLEGLIDRVKYYKETPPPLETLEDLKRELESIQTVAVAEIEEKELNKSYASGFREGKRRVIAEVLQENSYTTRGQMIAAVVDLKVDQ